MPILGEPLPGDLGRGDCRRRISRRMRELQLGASTNGADPAQTERLAAEEAVKVFGVLSKQQAAAQARRRPVGFDGESIHRAFSFRKSIIQSDGVADQLPTASALIRRPLQNRQDQKEAFSDQGR